jgi:hypothetical protein
LHWIRIAQAVVDQLVSSRHDSKITDKKIENKAVAAVAMTRQAAARRPVASQHATQKFRDGPERSAV